ncbi:MAG: Crp/Fnr family transcriptional regulator [Candidatus Kapaibacterium sp.]|nr:MAG: Crp/Fnr family transcriptional regulator [Candidatus Kapabacteria bacterium]
MIPTTFPTTFLTSSPHYEQALVRFLREYTPLSDEDIRRAAPLWREKHYAKHDFFNARMNVCTSLGYVLQGVFRVYYLNEDGEEINIFFFAEHQFCVSFKSFTTQTPCQYYVESLSDALVLEIRFADLQELYRTSHGWERFGRRFAEDCFTVSQLRTESFLFQTPEERYVSFQAAYPDLANRISLSHIASFLGVQLPSLSRIRKRLAER